MAIGHMNYKDLPEGTRVEVVANLRQRLQAPGLTAEERKHIQTRLKLFSPPDSAPKPVVIETSKSREPQHHTVGVSESVKVKDKV